ncbi:MAG: phytanoyl-CoA dioxygenase family protein [Chloroflexi bacterium]|nr:phytanoyl-CoA dioxygenase family protein [Chloroflexota bacterium]
MPLTDAQVAQFRADGYLVVEDVVPLEHVEAMRRRIDAVTSPAGSADADRMGVQLEPDAPADGALPRKLNELAPHDVVFERHAESPELLEMVGQLIGEPLRLYSDQAFLKPPRQGSAKPPHQDNAHFGIDPADWGVTVWCALDDATEANGCMQYFAGSHLEGAVPHVWEGGTTHLIPERLELPAPVHAPVRAGGVIFHHLLTFHMSAPNTSDAWRRAYACHYIRTDASHMDEEPIQAMLGEDHPLKR